MGSLRRVAGRASPHVADVRRARRLAADPAGRNDLYVSLSGRTAPKDWDMPRRKPLLPGLLAGLTHARSPLALSTPVYSVRRLNLIAHGAPTPILPGRCGLRMRGFDRHSAV